MTARRPERSRSIAVPIFRDWVPDAEHPFDLVDEAGEWIRDDRSFDEMYLVSGHFRLEPKFWSNFFSFAPLTELEFERAETELERPIPVSQREALDRAVRRFIAGVGLARTVPRWNEIATRLTKMISACRRLLTATEMLEDKRKPSGVIGSEKAVRLFVASLGLDTNVVRHVMEVSAARLKEIKPLASKKGEKGDMSYRVLLRSAVQIAEAVGSDLSVPSNSKLDIGDYEEKALLRFVRLIIQLSRPRAEIAFERLSEDDRDAALRTLISLVRKNDRSVVEHLRIAKKAVQREHSFPDVLDAV